MLSSTEEAAEQRIRELKSAIRHRDGLLQAVSEQIVDTRITDRVGTPLPHRIMALEAQLKVRDDLLEQAGRVADHVMQVHGRVGHMMCTPNLMMQRNVRMPPFAR